MNISTVKVIVPRQIYRTREHKTPYARPIIVFMMYTHITKGSPNRYLQLFRKIQVMFSSCNISIGIVWRTSCIWSADVITIHLPTTQLVPAWSAASAAFTHFGRLPNVSWLMWVYPAGAKCLRKKDDFPRHGKPVNSTSSVSTTSGIIVAVGGSSNGTGWWVS